MKILLVAATELEVKPLIQLYAQSEKTMFVGLHSLFIKSANNSVDLLITGAGINSATYFITNVLNAENYGLVIQTGICGSFDRNISLGDVVEITEETFAQAGAEDDENFMDLFELGLKNKNEFPFTNGWIKNDSVLLDAFGIKQVRGITVETVHGNQRTIERTYKKYSPDVESMEGACLFYCCKMKQIPFVQIRSVSNYVEKRNKENWNIKLAVVNLNNFLIELFNRIMV